MFDGGGAFVISGSGEGWGRALGKSVEDARRGCPPGGVGSFLRQRNEAFSHVGAFAEISRQF